MNLIISILTIVFSSICTLLISRSTYITKSQREIFSNELDNLYVPLIRFFIYDSVDLSEINKINKLSSLLNSIIHDNFKFIPDELLKLSLELHKNSSADDMGHALINYNKIESYSRSRYEKLKMVLGFPANNFKTRWKWMTPNEKIFYLGSNILFPLFLFFCFEFGFFVLPWNYSRNRINMIDIFVPATLFSIAFTTYIYKRCNQ